MKKKKKTAEEKLLRVWRHQSVWKTLGSNLIRRGDVNSMLFAKIPCAACKSI